MVPNGLFYLITVHKLLKDFLFLNNAFDMDVVLSISTVNDACPQTHLIMTKE